jgi:hypothetical protein
MAFEEANLKMFVVSVPTCLNRTAFLVGSDPIAGRWLAGSRCSIISCCQRRVHRKPVPGTDLLLWPNSSRARDSDAAEIRAD